MFVYGGYRYLTRPEIPGDYLYETPFEFNIDTKFWTKIEVKGYTPR